MQDWPLAFTAWSFGHYYSQVPFTARTTLLPSGFYYFLPIYFTKTVLNNTSGY